RGCRWRITDEKCEPTALARPIAPYETSILPFEDCCSLFVPSHPATRARARDGERREETMRVAGERSGRLRARTNGVDRRGRRGRRADGRVTRGESASSARRVPSREGSGTL